MSRTRTHVGLSSLRVERKFSLRVSKSALLISETLILGTRRLLICSGVGTGEAGMAVEVPVSSCGRFPSGLAIVDDQDSDLARFRWYNGNGYARRETGGSKARVRYAMHRIILERIIGRPIPQGLVADHIDGNPLNNTRANLREVTIGQNVQNRRGHQRNSTTNHRNVTYNKRDKCFRVQITKNGKHHNGGSFSTLEEAVVQAERLRSELGVLAGASTSSGLSAAVTRLMIDGRAMNRNNSSGYRGVTKDKRTGRWVAQVSTGGKKKPIVVYGGSFGSAEEAAAAASNLRAQHAAQEK